jgi:hypothetical protein
MYNILDGDEAPQSDDTATKVTSYERPALHGTTAL